MNGKTSKRGRKIWFATRPPSSRNVFRSGVSTSFRAFGGFDRALQRPGKERQAGHGRDVMGSFSEVSSLENSGSAVLTDKDPAGAGGSGSRLRTPQPEVDPSTP